MMKNQKLMNDNRRYWQHRLNEAEKQRQKRDDRLDRQMQRMYDKAYRDIQKELDAFYGRYMKRTGLSAEEVRKAAKYFDIKAFEERAKYYVENRDFSPRANTELALYNFKMRYNQLELLQANLDLTLIELGAKEESAIKKAKLEEIRRTYKENAGILGLSVPSEERLKQVAQSAINKPYYGAHFSERIWSGHINPLRKYLNDRVSLTILAGQSPELLARDLKKRFDVTTNEARRLAVTEVGFMETEAQKLSYVDAGFERYGIQPEANACPQCRAIVDECEAEGGFLVAGMNPGLNAPLFHPWCRCGTYPIVPRDELGQLIKTDDYEENEKSNRGINKNTRIDKSYIESNQYRRLFDKLGEDLDTTRSIYQAAKEMLYHRDGTEYEDIAMVMPPNKRYFIRKDYDVRKRSLPTESMKKLVADHPFEIISIHNHPTSSVPSSADLKNAINHKYKYGLVITHDGTIYRYTPTSDYLFDDTIYNASFKSLEKSIEPQDNKQYNQYELNKFIKTMNTIGIKLEVFK